MAKVQIGRYKPNHASLAKFLMSSRVDRVSQAAAEDIARAAATAERARPKRSGAESSGRLAEGYRAETDVGAHDAEGGPRRVGVVVNDVPYAATMELDDSAGGGHHILERTAAPWHVPQGVRRTMGRGPA